MANKLQGKFSLQLTDDLTVDVCLNLYALNLFLEEEDAKLDQLQELLEQKALANLPKLGWAGVRTQAILSDQELPLNFTKFAALFGSVGWDEVSKDVLTALQLDTKKK